MKTMSELRKELAKVFDGVVSGEMELKIASEANNAAGKIINTVRTQLEYHKLRKDKPEIDFLKCK